MSAKKQRDRKKERRPSRIREENFEDVTWPRPFEIGARLLFSWHWKVLFYAICIYLHNYHLCDWNTLRCKPVFYQLSPYTFSIAGAIFKRRICGWKKLEQPLGVMRVPPATKMVREMRLKFFQVDQALEMLRVPLVTILAPEMRLKVFWTQPTFGDVANATSHDIGERNAIEIFWSRPTFGDVASAASHDVGARNAIESFLKSTNVWRCCECR